MNVRKKIKKNQTKVQTKYVKPPIQLFQRGTKEWLLTNVPKNIKYGTQLQQYHENRKLGKYVNLMENLKILSLEELKQMLIKNNQMTGGTKGDLVKKIYSRITDGIPQCPNCGEQDLDIFCSQKLYHCGECRKVIQQRDNTEWIY